MSSDIVLLIGRPESSSEFRLIIVSKSRSVINFLEEVSPRVHLVINLLGFALEAESAFLTTLEIINFLESLSFVNISKQLTLVVSMMLDHQLANAVSA